MERLRTLTRAAGLAPFAVALATGIGCVTVDSATKSVKLSMHAVDKPASPASQVICFWQRRLAPLPDPTRDGQQVLGLPGQVFLVGPKEAAVEVTGDLAVMVYDETPRPPGGTPHTPEMWHFTKDVLKRLETNDERFGRSYALFLPWPPGWNDVRVVKIMARYKSPGPGGHSVDLYAGEQKITLDPSAHDKPVWTDLNAAGSPAPNLLATPGFDSRSVPDWGKALQQMQAGSPSAPAATASMGSFAPPAGGVGSTSGPGYRGNSGLMPAGGPIPPANWGQPQAPASAGPVQPIIVPVRGGV